MRKPLPLLASSVNPGTLSFVATGATQAQQFVATPALGAIATVTAGSGGSFTVTPQAAAGARRRPAHAHGFGTSASFNFPNGIACDSANGSLAVATTYNDLIRELVQ